MCFIFKSLLGKYNSNFTLYAKIGTMKRPKAGSPGYLDKKRRAETALRANEWMLRGFVKPQLGFCLAPGVRRETKLAVQIDLHMTAHKTKFEHKWDTSFLSCCEYRIAKEVSHKADFT